MYYYFFYVVETFGHDQTEVHVFLSERRRFAVISLCLSLGMSVHKGTHNDWNWAQVTDSARQECQ